MAESIEVREGDAEVRVSEADLAGLASLQSMTALRHVWVDRIDLTAEVLRLIAGLPQIASLTISGSRLTAEEFALLEALPPGAAVKVESQKHDSPEWNVFRHR